MIKFGTDGWRGIIADDFTFDNVRRVAGGIAAYVLGHEDAAHGVVVGYDTRFLSQQAARLAAETIAAAGIPGADHLRLHADAGVSLAVKSQGAAGGVVVTSSHNPWNWNGVKFKAKFGGSATPAIMKVIEEEVGAGSMPKGQAAPIKEVDLKPAYAEAICRFADLDLIAKANFRFAVDSMYGSGRGVLTGIFEKRGIHYVAIRQELNPLFPGINPEPIEPHIEMLRQTVLKERCHAGLAVDGDADRIGAIAEDGSFVDSHKCFAVLLRWMLERKKWPGDVVRAFNTTGMVDRIAAKYGRKLIECPIGFKYIADLMMEHEIVVGGEESGGIGYSRYLPERDGTLNCLLLGQRDGRRAQAAGAAGGRSAARVRAALLRTPRSAHHGRDEAKRDPAGGVRPDQPSGPVFHQKEGRARRNKVLPRRPNERQRSRSPGCCFACPAPSRCCGSIAKRHRPELVAEILSTAEAFVRAQRTTWTRQACRDGRAGDDHEDAEDPHNHWPSGSRISFSAIR